MVAGSADRGAGPLILLTDPTYEELCRYAAEGRLVHDGYIYYQLITRKGLTLEAVADGLCKSDKLVHTFNPYLRRLLE